MRISQCHLSTIRQKPDSHPLDIPEANDEDYNPRVKGKGKGKNRKKRKPDKIRVDLSQDLKSLCRSLAAVKEDPSLLSGINDEDVIMPKKKPTGSRKRGRPPKKLSNDPLEISPKLFPSGRPK